MKMIPAEIRCGDLDESGLLIVYKNMKNLNKQAIAIEKNHREVVEVYSLENNKITYLCDAANHELDYHRIMNFYPIFIIQVVRLLLYVFHLMV